MPVRRVEGRESPGNALLRQTPLDLRVFVDILTVVIVDERMASHLPIHGEDKDEQNGDYRMRRDTARNSTLRHAEILPWYRRDFNRSILVDEVVLVDDASSDSTIKVAQELGIKAIAHPKNIGYGANQKTCYREALRLEADIVVMIHPDYQYSPRQVLETLPLDANSNDFVFDNEILAQAVHFGFRIGEISCPTRYFDDASSIGFARSVRYGIGVLATSAKFLLRKAGVARPTLFEKKTGMDRRNR